MSREPPHRPASRFCPLRVSGRMTRCECHEMDFAEIGDYARRHHMFDLQSLIARLEFGQTCTACHSDLREYLKQHGGGNSPANPAGRAPNER